ncbi:hypothetical protein EZV73_18635 [Acidaminobacter sp. JC074]|uniref:hypothetical protein n=1 Tax=Acidaminobacter sp. JC074 TaxID=2530199 RepID=UPI001F0EBDF3|nr:hypothetical protein [Acidaminobacter sp. JC074]MCH4889606.1 hypothetical protein [Acidaminobacter sp. JC074]
MKKWIILILVILLVGCTNKAVEDVESFTFKARIQEITQGGYIVLVDEGEDVRNSSDLISISTDQSFELDDHVLIKYDGAIMESYPAQINMLSIEKID